MVLLDFVRTLSPEKQRPTHLAPLAEVLERMLLQKVRALSSVATRHGKTTLIAHWIAYVLKKDPSLEIIYFTFSALFAQKQNREFRRLAQEAGIELSKDHNTITEWRTRQGGGVFVCSADQDVIGRGAHFVIIDDPIGGPEDADNPEVRENVDDKIIFLSTRVHPGGSVLVNMSRFHPDDPIGRREQQGWEHIKLPAINIDTNEPLWPERWPLEELLPLRKELAVKDPLERTWWAQFMGEPQPDGGNFFNPPARYNDLPGWGGARDGLGVDMAFSQSKAADWFAIVSVRLWSDTLYIRNVMRMKADMTTLEANIRAFWDMYGHCPIFSYVSGPEIGAAQYLWSKGINLQTMKARYNKLVRSQKTRDRWNAGKILIPEHAPWVSGFLTRLSAFRGIEGDQDDEIDALVSASDALIGSAVTVPRMFGKPRM